MALALIYLFASLLVFLILTEVLTFNVSYDGESTVIDVNLMIFALRFIKRKNGKKRNKKTKKRSRDSFNFLRKISLPLIRRSEIFIENFNLSIPYAEPAANAFRHGIYVSFISSVIAYAEENSKKFVSNNIIIDYSAHNEVKTSFNFKIKISLLDMIICILSYAFERLPEKKGKSSYGRKQNE